MASANEISSLIYDEPLSPAELNASLSLCEILSEVSERVDDALSGLAKGWWSGVVISNPLIFFVTLASRLWNLGEPGL